MTRIQRMFSPVLLTVIALMTTACGFHLRGTAHIASEFEDLAIQGADRDFQTLLSKTLMQTGIRMDAGAPYQISIVNLNRQEQAVSISGGSIVTDYEVTATLVWKLENREGLTLIPATEIRQSSSYQRRDDRYNASRSEMNGIWNELQQNLATTLARQIAAISNEQLEALGQKAEQAAQAAAARNDKVGPLTP